MKQVVKKWKWLRNNGGYIKISSKRCRRHQDVVKIISDTTLYKALKEATCSNNTHICKVFWGPAWVAWRGRGVKGTTNKAIGLKIIPIWAVIRAVLRSKEWDFWCKMFCGRQPNEQPSVPEGWGGRGRVFFYPLWACLELLGFGGFVAWFKASTRFEAKSLGGFQ